MSNPLACFWCARSFEPHRGGSRQTFCRAACRAAYHKATRQWCEKAIADGRLTVEALRDGLPVAYTLPGYIEPPSPQSGIGSLEKVFLEPVTRFVVDVPSYTVEGLVKLGFIRPDQQDDLFAVIAALKRLGRTPSVSRIA
jgi:hypothetical protein